MALSKNSIATNQDRRGEHVPTEDKYETMPDGRQIVVARAGVPMPIGEAERYGLVGDEAPAPLGTIQSPVGNTLLMKEAQESGAADSPAVQASIAEVERVQNPQQNAKAAATDDSDGAKAKTPASSKAKAPAENK